MSKVIDECAFRKAGRPHVYPWGEWSDGQARLLTKGEDFNCEVTNFRSAVYNCAKRLGKKVRTNIVGDNEITIQFHE